MNGPRSRIPPLNISTPIVDPNTGIPTPQFMRLWQQLFGNENLSSQDASNALDRTSALEQRQIIAGTGLTGGGNLSADRTLALANTTVTPGSYTNTNLTVDAQGRITAASNGVSGTREVIYSNSQGIGTLASGGTALQVLASVSVPTMSDNDFIEVCAGYWRNSSGSRTRVSRITLTNGTDSISISRSASTNSNSDIYNIRFLRISSNSANIFGEYSQGTANTEVNGSGWLRRSGSRTAPSNSTFNWSLPVTLRFEAQVTTSGGVDDDIILGHAFAEIVRAP